MRARTGTGDPQFVTEARLLPALFHRADQASLGARDQSFHWYGWQMMLLLAAAVADSLHWRVAGIDAAAALAALAFFCALCMAVALHLVDPQELWYEGRAVAESTKTLVWKYAVRAVPFEGDEEEAEQTLKAQLEEVLLVFRAAGQVPAHALEGRLYGLAAHPVITPSMRALRAAPLKDRREIYVRDRIESQRAWYRSRARHYVWVMRGWSAVLLLMPTAGLAGGALEAAGIVNVDLLGIFAAVAASATAWTQLKQYRPLATAYTVATSELELVQRRIEHTDDERAWARLVRDAEKAISREHTTWQARRDLRV